MRFLHACLAILGTLTAAAASADDGWITLFDGTSLDGWKINEHPESWKLEDGVLTCHGERSHIFYVGPAAPFKDFELSLEVLTRNNSNSGVYFHTRFQETGWPQAGFECQVNNTYTSDPRKTGSLYAVKDVLVAPAKDDEWWTYNIRVEGKRVTISVNGQVVNEYVEPENAQPGKEFARVLGEGTFALQAHDPKSTVSFRNIRVRKLGGASTTAAEAQDAKSGVAVGDPAPVFTLKDDLGNDWNSAEHFAKGITVVYFYPADFTSGCTRQACAYRDDFGKLKDLGVSVVGISGDSVENHQAFKKFHDLNFTLLADPHGEAAKKFGVPVTLGEKIAKATIDGQEVSFVRTATIQRWTFVIQDGKVVAVNDKVNATGDSASIQELVKNLK
jgi:peroxiredoxin